MITNISWATYLCAVALLTVSWYLFVGFRYFYPEIKNAFGPKTASPLQRDAAQGHAPYTEASPNLVSKGAFEENSFNDFEIIEELVDRTKTLITGSVEKEANKSDFLIGLQHILKDYPVLRSSQFRPSVNEFITTECEAQGLWPVSMEEVENCWSL